MTLVVQPDFEFAAQDVKKFFALVCVGFAAATAGFDAEEMRFHGGVAPGEKLHADVGTGFEDFALGSANERLGVSIGFEHGKDIGFIETRDALESRDRRAHLATFESAEKTDRDFGGARHLSQGEAALYP